ncbi:PaaI family thioesterase [Desulforudis sp. 1088]|uniref:PaaI family thioesterase n=1 Tax=unclassified Candidatus Desulforudis TaxID=2635950 RepID=UPI003CE4DECC
MFPLDERATHMCFACSPVNPIGLKLLFEDDGDVLRTSFTPGEEHQGWTGWVHGGLISTVLDEAMAQWCWRRGMTAMTAEITVRFKKGVRIGERMDVSARMVSARGRLVELEAAAAVAGKVVATARSKFLKTRDQD